MLTTSGSRVRRRGIVLVLVLAMLGLLALVGITFASFAAQARMNNKNFMASLLQPQADELIDFGLAQLITDTNDIRSAIRGHSMANDMYGNDATGNDYLILNPSNGAQFSILSVASVGGTLYNLTTSIASGDPNFFGYNFTRWVIRVSIPNTQTVAQTFEVLSDVTTGTNRIFQVNIGPADGQLNYPVGANPTTIGTNLYNPTLAGLTTIMPGQFLIAAVGGTLPGNTFTLDGRWLHAFNGPGAGSSLASTGLPSSYYPNYKFNGLVGGPGGQPGLNVPPPSGPMSIGLDEDYDACDLENWFLAVQSADGSVTIPSFHRPGIIRWDTANGVNDWLRQNQSGPMGTQLWADSAARILRPCQADGHDAATFKDLYPDSVTGQINYDVDNDGDRVPDSVWVDLGYPARRDASGRLYKPLFAFMVIGLNGRIPLNTAGNLAAQVGGVYVPYSANPEITGTTVPTMMGGAGHAVHLGNSISEVDPTYALQNTFDQLSGDSVAAFALPGTGVPGVTSSILPANSQVDSAGIDVRLIQLRNLLAGTRPHTNSSLAGTGQVNGDTNFVAFNDNTNNLFPMPNSIADFADTGAAPDPNTGLPFLVRSTPPVPGRWGEAQSIPGAAILNPFNSTTPPPATLGPQYVNVVMSNYSNPVRAGYSNNIKDIMNGLPPDAADDNYNCFDPFPLRSSPNSAGVTVYGGEVGDADAYDGVGALIFPVERMRRWLAPADINGTGQVYAWNAGSRGVNRGYDALGRVEFNSYFRPAGSPGVINTAYSNATYATNGMLTYTNTSILPGAIAFPGSGLTPDPFYTGGPANEPPYVGTTAAPMPLVTPAYLPDMTSNPLHGLESARFPNQSYYSAIGASFTFLPQNIGGAPMDQDIDPGAATPPPYPNGDPVAFPTYDYFVNATVKSDGLNDADEMNLYHPNPLVDSPFGPGDIEWLYRQQDVDGASLSSRLLSLAPISFTNTLDGSRRRKMFALDSWDLNNFVWANDNPSNAFSTNSRFLLGANASMFNLGGLTPTLAHRDKKINLNYPLPVSNDPNDPIRQKWIYDTYYLLKQVLPPKAVDTPEELAQLSQYVINMIDFRDPDCTMTHWQNPDVAVAGIPTAPTALGGPVTVPTTAVTLVPSALNPTLPLLDQWGMEYNPVAINEVLAYSFLYATTAAGAMSRANRFFAELVNTQTSPELASTSTFNPVLDLGGFAYTGPATGGATDPYSGGCWDLVFTGDDPYSRPDPYRGQLVPFGNTYGLMPLNQDTFNAPATGTSTDVILTPLGQSGSIPAPTAATGTAPATDYFYAIGNVGPSTGSGSTTVYYETGGPSPTTTIPTSGTPPNPTTGTTYYVPTSTPSLMQTIKTTYDPVTGPALTTSPFPLYPGVLPVVPVAAGSAIDPNPCVTSPLPTNYSTDLPFFSTTAAQQTPAYYWVCLRRPANLFAPVSVTNPMVVVDAMRFPYMDATGPLMTTGPVGGPAKVPTWASGFVPYSVQRYQPYRGGHAVPVPNPGGVYGGAAATSTPVDPRYGYTEQIVVPGTTPRS